MLSKKVKEEREVRRQVVVCTGYRKTHIEVRTDTRSSSESQSVAEWYATFSPTATGGRNDRVGPMTPNSNSRD